MLNTATPAYFERGALLYCEAQPSLFDVSDLGNRAVELQNDCMLPAAADPKVHATLLCKVGWLAQDPLNLRRKRRALHAKQQGPWNAI
jgi:hypothetical protein